MKEELKKEFESKFIRPLTNDDNYMWGWRNIHFLDIIKWIDKNFVPVENRVIRFVGGNEPLNVGKLKKILADLDDDFTIDMRVRTKLTDEQLKNLSYPYPYNTEYTQLEFDDIGYSEKQLCLGCEIANKHV